MSICTSCGKKYSKWTTPFSAKSVCGDCFKAEPDGQRNVALPEKDVFPAAVTPETSIRKRTVPIRLSSFLPRSRSKVVFALVMGCYCIVGGAFFATWLSIAGVPRPPRAFYLRGDGPGVFGALILAPVLESLILVGVFELVRRVRAPDWVQVVTSALFISGLHFWGWWPHAFIVLPSFLIQCASYLFWRRVSWKQAYWVVVLIHAVNNVLPALSAVSRAIPHA